MGGSLARALAELEARPSVVGWSPSAEERDAALKAGALQDAPSGWREAVTDAELVVLATPLRVSCQLIQELASVASSDATLSDVASLKGPVARAAAAAGVTDRWVGSHPMAGSEKSGFGASTAGLFRGARVWTVAEESAASRVSSVHAFWRSVGARPAEIGSDEHDRLIAMASHLPQLTANALARVLADADISVEQLGPGGRDMTRLAASSADMWRDLLEFSSPELVQGLRALAEASERIADLLERGGLETLEEIMRLTEAWGRTS